MSTREAGIQQNESKKLTTKDLIYAGAFAAIYIVVMLVVVMGTGAVHPAVYLAAPLTMGIIGGTIYLLYTLKVHKFGAVLILGVIFTLSTGSFNPLAIATCLVAAVLAEIVLFLGRYRSKKMYLASYPFFNLNMAGPFAMLFVAKDQFLAISESYYGPERTALLDSLTPDWIWYAQLALAFVGGIIGAFIGNRLVKKHFEKAGIV